jgi:hypothetical protein
MNRSLRRTATVAAAVLAGLIAATSPALAAPIADGTSNTLQVGLTSATLDQAQHRLIVANPGSSALNYTKITYVGGSLTAADLILYNGHAGLGSAVIFNVPDVTVIPN